MTDSEETELLERLEWAIAAAEQEVNEYLQAAIESESWSLGDYLSEQKFTAAGEWIDRVTALTDKRFYAAAVSWAQLVAVRDEEGAFKPESVETPLLTLAVLDKEFPFDGIDEVSGERLDSRTVQIKRIGHCHFTIEEQLSCLADQGGSLRSAAEAGNVQQVVTSLAAIQETAAAMARAYGLWMRHLEPVWPQYNDVDPADVDAAYGTSSAFAAFRDMV